MFNQKAYEQRTKKRNIKENKNKQKKQRNAPSLLRFRFITTQKQWAAMCVETIQN